MTTEEFGQYWTLMRNLFPAASRLNSENTKMVWAVALEPYTLDQVTNATMDYARKNKFFPDIADITGGLPLPEEQPVDADCGTAWMLPYIQRSREQLSAARPLIATALRAVGRRTWPEARADGTSWTDWVADHDRARSLLPRSLGEMIGGGMDPEQAMQERRTAWADFWAAHGVADLGVP